MYGAGWGVVRGWCGCGQSLRAHRQNDQERDGRRGATSADVVPSPRKLALFPYLGEADNRVEQWAGSGLKWTWVLCPSRPLALLGHSAPDEILGGETLLHEHQPGPGELQQVFSGPRSALPLVPHVSKASVLRGQWHAGNPCGDFLRGCNQLQRQKVHCFP